MPQRRHAFWIRNSLVAVALAAASVSLAADLPLKPAPPGRATAERDGGNCQHGAGGEVSCSNVGIACVPKAAACTATDSPTR